MSENARANRNGSPCPPWCITDHEEALIPGRPELGSMNSHYSAPVTQTSRAEVKTRLSGLAGEPATVEVSRYTAPFLSLNPGQALALARMLDELAGSGQVAQLASSLRAAATTVLAQ